MKQHNGVKLLNSPKEIAIALDLSLKSGAIYRTYLPSKSDDKLKKRKILNAMDIYTYLQKHDISKETLILFVNTRKATIDEIMGKLK